MAAITVKVIDDCHLELERGTKAKRGGEIVVKIIEKKPFVSLKGARRYDVDSVEFVERLRKSRKIEKA